MLESGRQRNLKSQKPRKEKLQKKCLRVAKATESGQGKYNGIANEEACTDLFWNVSMPGCWSDWEQGVSEYPLGYWEGR